MNIDISILTNNTYFVQYFLIFVNLLKYSYDCHIYYGIFFTENNKYILNFTVFVEKKHEIKGKFLKVCFLK